MRLVLLGGLDVVQHVRDDVLAEGTPVRDLEPLKKGGIFIIFRAHEESGRDGKGGMNDSAAETDTEREQEGRRQTGSAEK